MAKYKILIKESAVKELNGIPPKYLKKIVERLKSLAPNPRPSGCQKLSTKNRYRLRQGDYRIIYSIQDDEMTVHIYKIGHRREVYRS